MAKNIKLERDSSGRCEKSLFTHIEDDLKGKVLTVHVRHHIAPGISAVRVTESPCLGNQSLDHDPKYFSRLYISKKSFQSFIIL